MPRTRLHLRLRPRTPDGAITWFSISGPLSTGPSQQPIREIICLLAECSGEPVRAVLAAAGPASWLVEWTVALSRVPADALDVRLRGRLGIGEAVRRAEHEQLEFFGGARGRDT